MIWQDGIWLWLLLLVPLLAGLFLWVGSARRRVLAGAIGTRLQGMLHRGGSLRLRWVRLSLLLLSLSLFLIALAGPSLGTEVREVERRSLDMVIALDLSRSMLARDVSPSRLEKARFELNRLIERSAGDRIGLIVFTGQAFLQSPMTSDPSALRLFLSVSHPDQMPGGTTRLASALELARETFERREEGRDAARVLVLVSDGEDQGSQWRDPLGALAGMGVRTYSVGLGTESGGRIPLTDPETGEVGGFQRERGGGEVVTRLEESLLQEVASAGGGEYIRISQSSDGVDALLNELGELERGELAVEEFADYANRYQWLLLAGLLLGVVAFLLPLRVASRHRAASGGILLLLGLSSLWPSEHAIAQSSASSLEPDRVRIGLQAGAGSDSALPFWQVHNRDGVLGEGRSHLLGVFSAQRSVDDRGRWGWGWGFTGAGRLSEDESLWLQEGWLEGRYGVFHLEAGRRAYTLGETGSARLSSGSLILGRNAPPIPRIRMHVPDFEPLPGTRGWISFKGQWAHGWFGGGRVIESAYVHEKSFHLQFGGPTWWELYGGFLHTATWGGRESGTGRPYPNGLGDFLRVATARAGDSTSHGVDQVNVLGAHQGLIEAGFKMEAGGDRRVHLYRQHLFSDKSGLAMRNLRDGLYGVAIENPFGESIPWIDGVLWEYLHTKHQTGPGPTDPVVGDSPPFCAEVNPNCGERYNGRDDYYNNEVYLDGWAYKGYALGTPLLMTRMQLDRVDPSIETYSDRYFVSTRVVAHHAGVEGHAGDEVRWRVLGTYARHHGTYWGLNLGDVWGSLDPALDPEVYYFNPPRVQWHWLAEADWGIPGREDLSFRLSLALDHGEMFESVGLTAGVVWTLR